MDFSHPRRTQEEIDALKARWREDPSFVLEDTPGFEAHRVELTEYRWIMEGIWNRQRNNPETRQQLLAAKAKALSALSMLELAERFLEMEQKVAKMEAIIDDLIVR